MLQHLFSTDSGGIGLSYLRVSIGASDLDPVVFSYNDLPPGKTDPELQHFRLSREPNVAFRTPSGQTVLIVLNEAEEPIDFTVDTAGRCIAALLPGRSVATMVW